MDEEEDQPEVRAAQLELVSKPVAPISSEIDLENQFVKQQLARNVSLANIRNLPPDAKSPLTSFQQVF